MCKENLNFGCLEKFIGYNVFIQNKDIDATYLYKNLLVDWNTYNQLILIDGDNGLKTWIPLDNIEEISNLSDDLYFDVVEIETIHYVWRIGCAEERPVLPRCFKCGKEINVPEETVWWSIHGTANYGSYYDSIEENQAVNNLIFCDECLHNFVGDIEVVGEYSELPLE